MSATPNQSMIPRVEITDLARAILALEVDRSFLSDEVRKSRESQVEILRKAMEEVDHLVKRELWLNKRITGVDEAITKLLNAKVV